MRIASLLRTKGAHVHTVTPQARLGEVVDLLDAHQIGALVVSTDGRHIEGVVSERDVVRTLRNRGSAALDATVADVMSTDVHTCVPDDETEHLMELMTNHRVRHIPVVMQGELAGIVSIGDVVKTRISELEFERRALVDYITTGR